MRDRRAIAIHAMKILTWQVCKRLNFQSAARRQADIAKFLNVHRTTYSRLKHGHQFFSFEQAVRVVNLAWAGNMSTPDAQECLRLLEQVASEQEEHNPFRELEVHSISFESPRFHGQSEGFYGPEAFMNDLAKRLLHFANVRISKPLTRLLDFEHATQWLLEPGKHRVVADHLATVDRASSFEFLKTPISTSISAVLYTGNSLNVASHRTLEMIRQTLSATRRVDDAEDLLNESRIVPIVVPHEIGELYLRGSLGRYQEISSYRALTEFSAQAYEDALKNRPKDDKRLRVAVLSDYCGLLLLKRLGGNGIMVFGLDAPTDGSGEFWLPRYPMGMAVDRSDRDLIERLRFAWELYLESNAVAVADLYIKLFDSLRKLVIVNAKSISAAKHPEEVATTWAQAVLRLGDDEWRDTISPWRAVLRIAHTRLKLVAKKARGVTAGRY